MKRALYYLIDFLKIWFFMLFTYAVFKILFNDLFLSGLINLKQAALKEILSVPLGQAVAFWLVTWKKRIKGQGSKD